MQDPALAVIAICGFSVICIGLIVIVGFLVFRFTGRSIGGLLGGGGIPGVINSISGANDPDEDEALINSRRRRSPGTNLRAQAQSLDFDSAVAKYKNQPLGSSPTTTPTNSPFPPAQPTLDDSSALDVESRRKRKRRRHSGEDEEGDEMFEHFLDEGD
ncbi:MAG: hypothetical protein ABI690_09850 [Chloroflexota bacterium]